MKGLVAADAQLCRWSNALAIENPAYHAAVSTALANAIGKTLAEVGEIEITP